MTRDVYGTLSLKSSPNSLFELGLGRTDSNVSVAHGPRHILKSLAQETLIGS